MKIDVIALFPEIIIPALQVSILKRAQDAGFLTVNVHNLRDFASDRHQTVDDYPYGGGAGMILKPEPVFRGYQGIESAVTHSRHLFDPPRKTLYSATCGSAFS